MPGRALTSRAKRSGAGRGPSAAAEAPPGAIGVSVEGRRVALAVVNESGSITSAHQHPIRSDDRAERLVGTVASCIRSCLGGAARSARTVGVGLPGAGRGEGPVISPRPLAWQKVDLRSLIEKQVGMPTFATSAMRAATLAEWRFGAGRGEDDLVCIFIGTGVGGGIVANGNLRLGDSNSAGEIGHMTIQLNGRNCHCSSSGCLEAYVGGWAIAERAREIAATRPAASGVLRQIAGGVEKIQADTVAEAYRAGDPLAQQMLEETVEYLAAGLVSLVNALNPHLLILGGSVIDRLPPLLPATEARVRQRALPTATRNLRLVRASLGDDAPLIGAATMAREFLAGGSEE